jgi:hypothetical protein
MKQSSDQKFLIKSPTNCPFIRLKCLFLNISKLEELIIV